MQFFYLFQFLSVWEWLFSFYLIEKLRKILRIKFFCLSTKEPILWKFWSNFTQISFYVCNTYKYFFSFHLTANHINEKSFSHSSSVIWNFFEIYRIDSRFFLFDSVTICSTHDRSMIRRNRLKTRRRRTKWRFFC